MPRTRQQVHRDIQHCLADARLFAIGYTALGGIAVLVTGLGRVHSARDAMLGLVIVLAAALYYWLAAHAAGLVVGLLRPWTASHLGAMAVGFVAAIPVVAGAVPFLNAEDRSPFPWAFVLFAAAIFGPIGAMALRAEPS